MLNNYASCKYVVTSVTLYRSVLVDLSHSRSVHALEHEPCCPDPIKLSGTECKAVHYGFCSPLLKLPPFSIPPPPAATSSPNSPAHTLKSTAHLHNQIGSSSKPTTPTTPAPPLVLSWTPPSKVDLASSAVHAVTPTSKLDAVEVVDPLELLATDLEGQLEALVNSFVAQDKVRVAARKKGVDIQGSFSPSLDKSNNLAKVTTLKSSSPTPASSPQPNKTSPVSSKVTKTKDGASSGHPSEPASDKKVSSTNSLEKKTTVASKTTIASSKKAEVTSVSSGKKNSPLTVTTAITKESPGKTAVVTADKIKQPVLKTSASSDSATTTNSKDPAAKTKIATKNESPKTLSATTTPKISPEYQQSGVKAQINKFGPKTNKELANQNSLVHSSSADNNKKASSSTAAKSSASKSNGSNTPDFTKTLLEVVTSSNDTSNSSTSTPSSKVASDKITLSDVGPATHNTVQKTASSPQSSTGGSTSTPKVYGVTKRTPKNVSKLADEISISDLTIFSNSPDSAGRSSVLNKTNKSQTIREKTTNSSPAIVKAKKDSPPDTSSNYSSPINSQNVNSSPSKEATSSSQSKSDSKQPQKTSKETSSLLQTSVASSTSFPVSDETKSAINSSSKVSRQKSTDNYILSAVDYAKTRFQNVSQVPKTEDLVKPKGKNGTIVNDAKNRWENSPTCGQSPAENAQHSPMTQPKLSNSANLQDDKSDSLLQSGGHHLRENGITLDSASPQVEERYPTSSSPKSLSPERSLDGAAAGSLSIPHPRLTSTQKQHIRERSLSPTDKHHAHLPVRPFLTKGSVAERVLLFERCPERSLERSSNNNKNKTVLYSTWKTSELQSRILPSSHSQRSSKDGFVPTSSHKRPPRSGHTVHIPRFYFPNGLPQPPSEIESQIQVVSSAFSKFPEKKAYRDQFGVITKACDLPLYWKIPLFMAAGGEKTGFVTCDAFLDYWKRVISTCYDDASKFVRVLSCGLRNYLLPNDFISMIQDVIDTHPGLTFLKEATEFHSRYVHTVIARIYYCANRSWSGKLTAPELRKSNFLQVLSLLDEEEDINQITEYFSYEHFYVIYCKFWELDKDHDLYIDKYDLTRHNEGAISSRMIERIFSGAVTRGPVQQEGKMSYTEFVWFLISEEDKRHPTSIEYWFRCMDIDGDGFLSMYELEYFYEEQLQRMEALGIETLPFKDCLCQMLDMVRPKVPGLISLADLKRCRMTPMFFDTFFNLEKFLDHEQRDPFASQRDQDGDGPLMSDWDRYAAEEYELLVAEEGATEQQDDMGYDDYDQDDEELMSSLHHMSVASMRKHGGEIRQNHSMEADDDEYDYADSDADYHY